MKYQFIFERHVRYSIEDQCDVLSVTRSGYYSWRSRAIPQRQLANWELLKRVRAHYFHHHRRYGSPRITQALRQEGICVSRNRVARLMREDHLAARPRRRYVRTTTSDHANASPNLLKVEGKRLFHVAQPDVVMTSDITFVDTLEGWLYVATVMDLCTRKIVGLAMRSEMTVDLVREALQQALGRRTPQSGLIVHSDRGSQYSSRAYRKILHAHGIRQSMSEKGNCWDNAPMESFFKTLKVELVYQTRYATREQAKRAIFEYIEVYYNRQRLHSALNYQTPEAFELAIIKQ